VLFWIALVVFLAGFLGGLAFAILRAIALWRQLKRTGGSLSAEASRIADVADGIQTHLDRAAGSSAKLREATQRLAVSRAALEVELQALREAQHTVRRLLWFVPGM
jgi:hypothetical protein